MDALEKQNQARPDQIDAFKMLVIALDEDSRQDDAIACCRAALALDLRDGTKAISVEKRTTWLVFSPASFVAPTPA